MNAVTETNTNTAVAMQGAYDPYAAYGQEAANAGAYLKFSKGEWQLGQNADEVALGRRLAANMDELSIGWIRWADGKPAERRMGLLVQGFKPEARDALGYTDESEWELDEESRPKDPWSFTNELPLADPADGEQMTFSASSKGGIGCIGNLCKAFSRAPQRAQGLVPVLELQRDSYMHPVYKKTYVPVLNIVDWVENGSVPAPAHGDDKNANSDNGSGSDRAASGAGGSSSAEKPATEAAGSKTRF